MDRKKSKKADLEWRKSTFFQLGIVISLSLVLMAFELVKSPKNSNFITIGMAETPDDIVLIQTKHELELPKPIIKPIVASVIETVDNNQLVESILPPTEYDPNESIPDYIPIEEKPEDITTPHDPFIPVEIMPEFPGGEQELMKFLKDNIVYPKIAIETNISGKVIVSFIVESDGSLSNIGIARSASPSLDKEALRVVEKMPKWSPGKQRQKPVRVNYNLPIDFILR